MPLRIPPKFLKSQRTLRILIITLFTAAFPVMFTLTAYVQGLLVLQSTNPVSNTHAAPLTTTVSITYGQPMSATTVSTQTFAVYAMQTGLLIQTYSVNGGQIKLTPTGAFKPGELVQVSATTGTLDITGTAPLSPTVWQFWVAVGGGSGQFTDSGASMENNNSQAVALGDLDGDASPSAADFGSLTLGDAPITHTFTISNSGNADLNLTGSPAVTLTAGGHFSVTAQPASPVISNSVTTFDVTFDPSAAGSFTDTVNIANDDPDENPYTFVISGTGVVADLSISKSVTPATAAPGDAITYTLTFSNTGSGTAAGVVITDIVPSSQLSVISHQVSVLPRRGASVTPGTRPTWRPARGASSLSPAPSATHWRRGCSPTRPSSPPRWWTATPAITAVRWG